MSLRKVSAPKGIQFGKLATSADMNINLADFERQDKKTRQEEEKTILRKELERKELEAKLQSKEQEFKREIQQIKLEHEKRLEDLKIEELDKR